MTIIQGRHVEAGSPKQVFETEVVVVGTGAGGGPFAAELAEAGVDVILVEEGGYYQTSDFTTDAAKMVKMLYRSAGATMAMGKPNVNFMEGRCVGGSTVINAGISWRTPARILKRWHWEHGVDDCEEEHMKPFFEKVEERVHVAPQSEESYGGDSEVFMTGSEKLGYRWLPVRRNQKHCVGTNNCILGCPTGAKQSVLITYIPRALVAGARLLSDCRVTRINHDGKRATGITAEFIDENLKTRAKVEIRAQHVVMAAGAVQTPTLLKKSKVADPHRNFGENLNLHPNSKVVGIFDRKLEAWKGAIQGIQITEFMEEGLMFGTTFVPPSVHAITLPYWGNKAAETMEHLNQMVTGAVLVEDVDSVGRVRPGFGGEATMTYALGKHDYHQLRRGIALLAEIYFAAGATEVHLPYHNLGRIHSPDEIPKIFDPKLKAVDLEVLTVHAMCTARMGRDPKSSSVDSFGRVHGYDNLYVSDASLFPSPIGVNPMISIMSLATRNAAHWLEVNR